MTAETGVSSLRVRIQHHVLLAAPVALVVGVIDGVAAAASGTAIVVCAGTLALVGAIYGVVQAVAVAIGMPVAARLRLAERFARAVDDRGGSEAVILEVHADGVALTVAALAAVAPLYVIVTASESIQIASTRVIVLVVGGIVAVLAAFVVRGVMLLVARRFFKWLHGRVGLPRPRGRAGQYCAFVFLPTTAFAVPVLYVAGGALGPWRFLVALVIFTVWQGMLHFFVMRVRDRLPRVALARLTTLLVVLGAVGVSYASVFAGMRELERSTYVTQDVTTLLRAVTDFDRDGHSALFGGGDCAPYDAARGPSIRDEANNGVDEDCDGSDAVGTTIELKTYSDALEAGQKKKYNVLFVVVDSVRPDHMSAYGYSKDTTPFLKGFSKDAWVFWDAHSQATATSLSMPSMFSGRRPASIDWKNGRYYPQPVAPFANLPRLLADNGYDTAIAVNYRMKVKMPGVIDGHQHIANAPKGVSWRSGGHLVGLTIQAMERAKNAKRPFYIVVHLDDAHVPYTGGVGRALPRLASSVRDVTKFDRGIAMTDHYLQAMVAHLQNLDLYDETIIIYTADHGEAFGEHNEQYHGFNCLVEQSHVPLIVRVPGLGGKHIHTRVSLTDIAPTITELLGLPETALTVDGQSLLVPVLRPDLVDKQRPVFCYVHRLFQKRPDYFVESVRSGNYHLHRDIMQSNVQFFDVEKDPKEKRNLADGALYKAELERLSGLLTGARRSNFYSYR